MAVPDQIPEVITLFECPTPDIDEKLVVDVHKLPPIPTPPVTAKSPVDVDVEAVPEVIAIPEAKYFNPNIVCAVPEIKPVDALPAKAILNVCVEPMELIVKPEPEIELEKYCVVAVRPFRVKPEPLADIKIQERFPAASELKTEEPVDGDDAGQI